MPGQTGLIHFAMTNSNANPIGQLIGGQWGEDINVQLRGGIGGVGVNVPGASIDALRVQYLPTDAYHLITSILRGSYPNGAMTGIDLHCGDDEVGLSGTTWNCQECAITCEAEAAMMVDLLVHELTGHCTRGAGGQDHSTAAKTTFEWFRSKAQIGAANAGIRRVVFTVRNNLVPFYSLNAVASGSERFPEYGSKGNEMVTLSLMLLQDHSKNLQNDEMQTLGNVVATMINNAGSPLTATITAAAPQVYSWSTSPASHDQLKQIDVAAGLDPNSGSFTTAVA